MRPAPLPEDEEARLAALHRLGVLDTPAEERFDVFTRLAASVCRTPIAVVSLTDADRQWFKSVRGMPEGLHEIPRDLALCAYAILRPDEVMVVPDATRDRRFADNPLVLGAPGIRFYAAAPLRGPDGDALGVLCVIDTVPREPDPQILTALRDLADGVGIALRLHELRGLVRRDALTGLGNRRLLDEALEAALAAAGTREAVGLLSLDLDRFKTVNDTYGHPAGDALLREVGRRILAGLRSGDIATRLGGDEFCVLLPALPPADAERRAEATARRLSESLARGPVVFDGRTIPMPSASVGVAVALPEAARAAADRAARASRLAQAADVALYNAKRPGRRRVSVYAPDLDRGIGSKHTLAADLRAALGTGGDQLSLALQPICEPHGRRVVGFEALLRWRHPRYGSISPADFIPVAERDGTFEALDRWVLRHACQEAARWPADAPPLAVNITPAFLAGGQVVDAVRASLAEANLPAARLSVEMTERAFLDDVAAAADAATALRGLGVEVAVDDFGAGHASFAYLKDVPFSKVKLDRSLSAGLPAPGDAAARGAAIVEGLVATARRIGVDVVAEGVEDEAQLAFLIEAGCEAVQGWLLGRPLPAPVWRDALARGPPLEAGRAGRGVGAIEGA